MAGPNQAQIVGDYPSTGTDDDNGSSDPTWTSTSKDRPTAEEIAIRRKVDIRLCTIAGLLCSLNLLDSGIISSASVTTLFQDLDLGVGNRYSVSIFIFTVASIAFQLPSTLAVRYFGPRLWFGLTTFCFGIITLCTAFIQSWRQMIVLRVLLGISASGIYPGLTYLISTWYPRNEQQLRFAYLQTGEVFVLATGGIVNFGLQHLDGEQGLAGWRWMFLVQGAITALLGIITFFWMVDFPENAHRSLWFLSAHETAVVVARIDRDRGDVKPMPWSWRELLSHGLDPKTWGFACMFFCQNVVSTALSYFLPLILQGGLGYSTDQAILLAVPPYYYAIVPVVVSSYVGDRLRLRGPVIIFNCTCLIAGMGMLGFAESDVVRYIGTFLATGAYVSNWAAISAFWANNVVGQWKRTFVAAMVTAFNGAGGITGSFIFKQVEAPRYSTAIWVSIGSQIVLMGFVVAFSAFFLHMNKLQRLEKTIIEGVVDFRYTY